MFFGICDHFLHGLAVIQIKGVCWPMKETKNSPILAVLSKFQQTGYVKAAEVAPSAALATAMQYNTISKCGWPVFLSTYSLDQWFLVFCNKLPFLMN